MKIQPCACRLSRSAAATCPREATGRLVWTPAEKVGDRAIGPMVVRPTSGDPYTLTFGSEWEHVSSTVARDHARIRHLDFESA